MGPVNSHSFPPRPMRQLLLAALPTDTSLFGAEPDPRHVYLPASHVKALHPSAMVVTGIRGAGKSFWWLALQQPRIRALVAQWDPHAEVGEQSQIAVGFQTALDFRTYRRLRVKCFLRVDQLDEGQVTDFPDASKVLASRVELTWPVHDLYGLLWQYLANATHPWTNDFRQRTWDQFQIEWATIQLQGDKVWRMSPDSVHDENKQRNLVHAIAGKWMGRDRRRGFPYTWIPGHLADAVGRTSPRTFLVALREAAEDTQKRYPEHTNALHYESIKRGVQKASRIRVDEVEEDYPWVDLLMKPLQGLNVPCAFDEVVHRWREQNVFRKLETDLNKEPAPPFRANEEDPEALRRALENSGIFMRTRDGRVNIPDVFRVGYGLGRRGGVKPLQAERRA